jgi:hypothetical protein
MIIKRKHLVDVFLSNNNNNNNNIKSNVFCIQVYNNNNSNIYIYICLFFLCLKQNLKINSISQYHIIMQF